MTAFNGIATQPGLSTPKRAQHFLSRTSRVDVLTPLLESILAVLAIAALAAGVLINASLSLESDPPGSSVSMEYETN